MNFRKIITPADACAIRKNQVENDKENMFFSIMEEISRRARHQNFVEFQDWAYASGVKENPFVEFLQANPEQVDRLSNMGYAVEQEVDDSVEHTYEEQERYFKRHFFFWQKEDWRAVKKTSTVTIRKFIISWECEDCDDSRNEETV